MEIIAYTLDLIGKLLISFTAIMVHHRVQEEHRIDKQVFEEMKREKQLAIVGVGFMVAGYMMHLFALV